MFLALMKKSLKGHRGQTPKLHSLSLSIIRYSAPSSYVLCHRGRIFLGVILPQNENLSALLKMESVTDETNPGHASAHGPGLLFIQYDIGAIN